MAVLNEIFDYDEIKEFLSGELNNFSSPIHLRIQDEKIKNLNAFMIAEEFQRRGLFVVWEKKSKFEVLGLKPRLTFKFSHLKGFSRGGERLLRDKHAFKTALRAAHIGVPAGIALPVDEKIRGQRYVAERKSPFVVKPACGHKGKGVTVGVRSDAQFDYAWDLAVAENRRESSIVIEEQFLGGVEARFLVVGGKCISVCRRIPPIVVGDGIKTIEGLIEEKNEEKSKSPGQVIRQVKLDQHRIGLIKAQGFALSDVPKPGTYVLIDYKAGASTGADTLEFSDLVHPGYHEIAEEVSRVANNTPILGVDIISKNFSAAPTNGSYVVLEANIAPGLSGHCYPSYGKPKDIVTPIVDYALSLVQPRKIRNIPSCDMIETPLIPDVAPSFDAKYQAWLESSMHMEGDPMPFAADGESFGALAKLAFEHNKQGESLVFFEKANAG